MFVCHVYLSIIFHPTLGYNTMPFDSPLVFLVFVAHDSGGKQKSFCFGIREFGLKSNGHWGHLYATGLGNMLAVGRHRLRRARRATGRTGLIGGGINFGARARLIFDAE